MRPDDPTAGPYDDDTADDIYDEADRLYQGAYDAAYPDEGEPLDAEWYDESPPWWRGRLRIIAVLAAVVAGVVALLLIARGEGYLGGQDVIRITATPGPPPNTAVTGSWPAGVSFASHTLPAMIKNVITLAGEQQGYRFSGQAGDTWTITVEAQSDTLDPLATLYAPSGEVVASNDDRSALDLTAEMEVTLPEDGSYRLLVESSAGGVTTGPYLLTVFVVG